MGKIVVRLLSIVFSSSLIFACLTVFSKRGQIGLGCRTFLSGAFMCAALLLWVIEYWQTSKAPDKIGRLGKKKGFDWGMHYFRAFAILSIMGCHYAAVFGYMKLVNVALTSCTIFFLFISGYLCQYIDTRRREAPIAYYRKKITNVICPFLIFSLLFAYLKGTFCFNLDFVAYVLQGCAQGQYWYIPFVSGLFLVSPLICRMGNRSLMLTLVVTFFFFLMFPFRPGGFALAWPHIFYLYTYFTFFYIVGFVYCRNRELIDTAIRPFWYLFAVGALFLLLILWQPTLIGLKCAERGLVIGMQRFLVLICALLALKFLKDRRIRLLDKIADYSFTLYFIHFGLFAMTHPVHDFLIAHLPAPVLFSEFLVFCLYVLVMLFVSIIFKEVFGKYSRSFLGT